MLQLLVIAVFVSLRLAEQLFPYTPQAPSPRSLLTIVATLATILTFLALLFAAVAAATGRALDQRGDFKAYSTLQRTHLFLCCLGALAVVLVGSLLHFPAHALSVAHAFAPFLFGLPDLLLVAPFSLFVLALWWLAYPVDARLSEALLYRTLSSGAPLYPIPSRLRYVLDLARHQLLLILLPILLVSAWQDAADAIAPRLPTTFPFAEILRWLGVPFVLLVGPALIRATWATSLLTQGTTAAYARTLFATYNLRIAGPYVWHTRGTLLNALVLGILYPFRYILLTDSLLEQLEDTHVHAVLGHEVGHVKHKHILWLILSLLAATLAVGWLTSLAIFLANINPDHAAAQTLLTLLYLASALLIFTLLSRTFEQQADIFAAAHLSTVAGSSTLTPAAAAAICGALQRVSSISGVSPTAPAWRHGSIASRCAHIAQLVDYPLARLPIDRTVRRIKLLIALTLLIGSALFFLLPLLPSSP